MTTINKQAITIDATGHVFSYGRADLSGEVVAGRTLVFLNDSARFVDGVPYYHHKVVAGEMVEMTAGEKSIVDDWIQAYKVTTFKGEKARIGIRVATLGDLPVPPPKAGYFIAIQNIAGVPGLAFSTNTNYVVFQSDGEWP